MTDYPAKFEKMRVAGKLAAKTLDMLTVNSTPGVTPGFIGQSSYELIRRSGGH